MNKLCDHYCDRVRQAYAHALVRNRAEAEDAAQQATLRGWERIRQYDTNATVQGLVVRNPAQLLHRYAAPNDQELDPRRAAEVSNQISVDPVLRAQFETLRDLDARWRSTARTAAFTPIIWSPDTQRITWRTGLGLAVVFVGLRIATKMIDTPLIAFAIHGAALIALLAAFAWMAREEEARSGIGQGTRR